MGKTSSAAIEGANLNYRRTFSWRRAEQECCWQNLASQNGRNFQTLSETVDKAWATIPIARPPTNLLNRKGSFKRPEPKMPNCKWPSQQENRWGYRLYASQITGRGKRKGQKRQNHGVQLIKNLPQQRVGVQARHPFFRLPYFHYPNGNMSTIDGLLSLNFWR